MKVIILAVLLACAAAAPAPLEEEGIDILSPSGNVQVSVNGVPEGTPLDIGHLLDIELNEHADGEVVSNNVLQPLTAAGLAAGIAEAAADSAPEVVSVVDAAPEAVVVVDAPETVGVIVDTPVILPAPIVLPEAAIPEIVNPIFIPPVAVPEFVVPGATPELVVPGATPELVVPGIVDPIVMPEPIVLPEPAVPEVIPETPASGDIYNDGLVQVTVNVPEDQGILNTLSSWMSLAINYVTGGVQTTNQIV